MLKITIPDRKYWDEAHEVFIDVKGATICLEHSLVSISKWETKWKKPFLGTQRTREETIDYIRCMTISQNVNPDIYQYIDNKIIREVNAYINDTMTATWFTEQKNKPQVAKKITNELIYYWMISCGIPFECQKWHLNRLLTLIRVCELKNAPQKKMGKKATLRQNAMINKQRRQARGSKG